MSNMLNLSKAESDNLLNLRKNTLQLCLEKTNLLNTKARVAVALDFSGSMSRLYKDGSVQAVIERLLPIAVQFDDNGEMDSSVCIRLLNTSGKTNRRYIKMSDIIDIDTVLTNKKISVINVVGDYINSKECKINVKKCKILLNKR